MATKEERLLAMIMYLISFFTVLLGPLVIWFIKKDESEFINYHGREYINFLISVTVYSIVSALLIFVLIGLILLPLIGLVAFILTIVAAIRAFEGEYYKFPFIFRIL